MLQTQLKHKSEVVRYGYRYGLRVENEHAQETHRFLRPEVAFLNGEAVESYKVGPLPFGTTKQGMMDLMKEWKWPARPVQPTGQSQDNTGVFWQVHATAMPSHWIYQLAHGDVLISRDTRSRETPSQSKLPVVAASRRTLNSLRASPAASGEDPWLHNDPWSGARERSKASAAMSQQQIQTMEEKVEKKVLKALNEKTVDQSMQVDGNSRIDDLESRVSSLAANLNMFQQQQQQQQHNQSLQTQIAGVHAQVEAQANAFGVAIDSKLNDQMSKIEALLRKRSHNEWLARARKSLTEEVRQLVRGFGQSIVQVPPSASWCLRSSRHRIQCCLGEMGSLSDSALVTREERGRRLGIQRCLKLQWQFALLGHRVGEAKNPGPKETDDETFVLGTANPTGLMHKASLIGTLPQGNAGSIYAISETHLTVPGTSQFQREISVCKSPFKLYRGAPVQSKVASHSSIGGKQKGVAFLSTIPHMHLG